MTIETREQKSADWRRDNLGKNAVSALVSKTNDIKRINELTEEISQKGNLIELLQLRDDYAMNLATIYGGFSWDYLPKGRFNVC